MTFRSRSPRVLIAFAVAAILAVSVPATAAGASSDPLAHTFNRVGKCHLIAPAPDAAPYGQGTCPGVRPGGIVLSNSGMCTMNFVFRGSDRRIYVGTAGHCISLDDYEKKWSGDRAPTAFNGYRNVIGKFVYGVLRGTKDFALFRLDKGVKYSPRMCHFGGPDGMYTKHDPAPTLLHQYGNGIYWGETLPARTHLAVTREDPDYVYTLGEAGPGDSGSGVIDANGEAVGVLVAGLDSRVTGIELPHNVPWISSLLLITRLDVQLKRASQVLKTKLTIISASVDSNVL